MNKRFLYTLIWASVIYSTFAPTYLFLKNGYFDVEIFLLLGSIVGLVLFTLFFWQYVLSLKVLTKFLKLDLATVIDLHKNIGIYSIMLLLTHPLYKLLDSYFNNGSLGFVPNFTTTYGQYVFIGQLALALVLFTWVISYLIKKYFTFRLWKLLHLLTYIILPLVYLHADKIGSFSANPLINIYIKALTIIFVIMVGVRIVDASGISKYKYTISSIKKYNDVLEITFNPLGKKMVTQMGQFVYLQVSAFGEAHPYSVITNDPKTGQLVLGVKMVGKFGKELEHLQINSKVFMDGPHGKFLENAESKSHLIFIAGGIGITPFVEFVKNSNKLTSVKRIDFFYATKTMNDAIFINKNEAQKWPKVRLVHVLSAENATEKNVESGMVTYELIKKYMNDIPEHCEFYICGPLPMMKAVYKQLVDNGIDSNKIHSEEFSW